MIQKLHDTAKYKNAITQTVYIRKQNCSLQPFHVVTHFRTKPRRQSINMKWKLIDDNQRYRPLMKNKNETFSLIIFPCINRTHAHESNDTSAKYSPLLRKIYQSPCCAIFPIIWVAFGLSLSLVVMTLFSGTGASIFLRHRETLQ